MAGYSLLSLLANAARGPRAWPTVWRFPEPKRRYDVVIVGGGGHGLATAYYLANRHGITDVAVLEKGWLGGGNTARNTTIVRSDYLLPANGALMDLSLGLWEGLARKLNYNVMMTPRGYVDLAHSDAELEAFVRRANAMRLRGTDVAILDQDGLAARVPLLDCGPATRFPVVGALVQERGGTARHDAVAWGYARGADARGVDIVQNCPVVGLLRRGGRITGVVSARGEIATSRVLLSVSGHSSQLAALAGLDLPIETFAVQAFVSEPVKPVLDTVVNFNAGMAYVSQTAKGEILLGGEPDRYNCYVRRGGFPRIEDVVRRAIAMFPFLARLRLMRQWAGIVDVTMDGSPILGPTVIDGLYLNAGWGYSGFKATPAAGWTLAHTIADGTPHPLIRPYRLERFEEGDLLDETGSGPRPFAH